MEVVSALILVMLGYWIYRKFKRPENPYVALHKLKVKNDRNYARYVQWCYKNGEIAMDKYDYIKEITDKENQIKEAVK